MRKILLALAAALFLGASAAAQGGFTTVTGTVTDPNGIKYACATISAQLITAGGASPTLNGGGFTTETSPVQMGCPTAPGSGASGSFAMRLADSGVISPSNTTWRFTVNTTGAIPPLGTGPQTFTYTTAINCGTNTPSTCTGNQLDISTQLSALAPALGFSGASSGGSVNPSVQFATAYYNTATTISGIPASPPIVNGSYLCGYDISGSVASAPSCDQTGLLPRPVTGATDTILFTDNNSVVVYQGAASNATVLPTPATLTNSAFYTVLYNRTTGVSTTVTVTPVTFTINGAASLVISQNQDCIILLDPTIATNWLSSCTGGGAGAFPRLDQVLDPTVDKTFAMGAHSLGFTWSAATGASDLLSLTDSLNNTGTGNLLLLTLASGSSLNSALRITGPSQYGIGELEFLSNSGLSLGNIFQVTGTPNSSASGVFGVHAVNTDAADFNYGIESDVTSANVAGTMLGMNGFFMNASVIGNGITELNGYDGRISITTGGVQDASFYRVRSFNHGAVPLTNFYGLNMEDITGATNNWAIKTGLGKVELGTVTGGTSGQLSYDPAASGSFPNLVLKAQDNSSMYQMFAGTGLANPPAVIEQIFPAGGSSFTGSFGPVVGSRVDLTSGANGAGAGGSQGIILRRDFCTTTNGSECDGHIVNISADASDGQNPAGTKTANGYATTITNNVASSLTNGFSSTVSSNGNNAVVNAMGLDASCTGVPCTTHALLISSGDTAIVEQACVTPGVGGGTSICPDSTSHEVKAATNGSTSYGTLVRAQPGAIHQTAKTAAITTATLCAASPGACNVAGQYHIHWDFIETGTACGTPATGGVTFLLTWTDSNATTHSAFSLGMDDASAINAVSQTFHFQTTLAAAWASGDFNISTNGSVIQYATGYTACGVGTGTYQLDAVVTRLQ